MIVHAGPFGNIAHGCSSVGGRQARARIRRLCTLRGGLRRRPRLREVHAHQGAIQRPGAARGGHRSLCPCCEVPRWSQGTRPRELRTSRPSRKAWQIWSTLIGMIKSFNLPVVVALNHLPDRHARRDRNPEAGLRGSGRVRRRRKQGLRRRRRWRNRACRGCHSRDRGRRPSRNRLRLRHRRHASRKGSRARQASVQRRKRPLGASRRSDSPPVPGTRLGQSADLYGKDASVHFTQARPQGRRPSGYTFQLSDVRASIGAGFIYPIAGNIVTMPGLPGITAPAGRRRRQVTSSAYNHG